MAEKSTQNIKKKERNELKERKRKKWIERKRKKWIERKEWMNDSKKRDKQTKEKLYKILKTKKGQTNFLMEDVLLRNKNWKDKVEKKKRNKTCKKYKMKKEKVQ